MRLCTISPGLASGFLLLGLLAAPASGQMMYYTPAPAGTYYAARPVYPQAGGYVYRNNGGVVPRFAPRGGVGTTPYLGNTRGLGAYSYNYDAAYRRGGGMRRRGWR